MDRRTLITSLAGLGAMLPISKVFGAREDRASGSGGIETIVRSREEWKAVLTEQQFRILREEGTERPFTSPLLKEKRKGTYVCAGCQLPLFKSEWKYESGTGWPSFYDHIPSHLETRADYKLFLRRTEYHCARCGGHQGHVFDDGPPPTGQRWCNNGIALDFIPDKQS